jgi:tetratricopeptide (TPR) repeat protein
VFYQFVEYLNFENETAELQYLASAIMEFFLNWMPGAYYIAMHHLLRAIELNPEDIGNKIELLYYFEVPERPLSIEKARFYANQILEVDPEYESAHRVLAMIKTMKERNEK